MWKEYEKSNRGYDVVRGRQVLHFHTHVVCGIASQSSWNIESSNLMPDVAIFLTCKFINTSTADSVLCE